MAVYNVLIVEDDPLIAETLEEILECLEHKVTGIADSAHAALKELRSNPADVILLDIQIKGNVDGVELAQKIKEEYDIPFIFTTAFADSETIQRAKEKGPYGYIVKPYGINDINAALEVAFANFEMLQEIKKTPSTVSQLKNNQLYIKADSRLIKIEDDDILYVEAKGDYAVFKTEEKGHIVHTTMKNIENKLDSNKFIRVHRSFIINLSKIIDIEDSNLLIGKKVIPVSRSNKEALIKRINLI
jgi:DNA-binding LytR/AlgR family response regulator